MVSRTRRSFLAAAASGCVAGVTGCAGERNGSTSPPEPTPTPDETATDSESDLTRTPDPREDMMIRLQNATAENQTVRLVISRNGDHVLDQEVALDPRETTHVDTGIERRGSYELTATVVDGPESSFPFSVDDYALRAGSNLIVTIHDDEVDILIEE